MIREGLQMKMNKTTRFILSKLFAIAIIALGAYLMGAYFNQSLPFGIQNEVLLAMWGFMGAGCILAAGVMGIGILKLFEKHIEKFIDELMWQKGLRRTRKGSR